MFWSYFSFFLNCINWIKIFIKIFLHQWSWNIKMCKTFLSYIIRILVGFCLAQTHIWRSNFKTTNNLNFFFLRNGSNYNNNTIILVKIEAGNFSPNMSSNLPLIVCFCLKFLYFNIWGRKRLIWGQIHTIWGKNAEFGGCFRLKKFGVASHN